MPDGLCLFPADDDAPLDLDQVVRCWRKIVWADRANWREWFPDLALECYPGPMKWSPTVPFPGAGSVSHFGTPAHLDELWASSAIEEELGDLLAGQPDVPPSPPPLNLDDRNQWNWRWQ